MPLARATLLPSPPPAALQASGQLVTRIAQAVAGAGGWLGFDRFMAMALYEPGLGYYSGGASKFGMAGDFVTAPLISPLFGRCLANQCAQWFQRLPPRITEFGAGNGELAAQLLAALADDGQAPQAYDIVELSGELAQRQRDCLMRRVPHLIDRVRWLDHMPASLSGVVLANEVLDAMPARVFVLDQGRVLERGVMLDKQGSPLDGAALDNLTLRWADRPADADFTNQVRAAIATAGWPFPDGFAQGYQSELGEQAQAWTRTLASRLDQGVALLIDYGFPAREFYHPQRDGGTLMCHYRHRAHPDPFWLPGLQDLTVHVDFDAVALAATQAGAQLVGYTSQANLLINCGLLEAFAARRGGAGLAADPTAVSEGRAAIVDQARDAQAVQRLVSESEMGELFKAIAFGRGMGSMDDESIAFARGDRLGQLAVVREGGR